MNICGGQISRVERDAVTPMAVGDDSAFQIMFSSRNLPFTLSNAQNTSAHPAREGVRVVASGKLLWGRISLVFLFTSPTRRPTRPSGT